MKWLLFLLSAIAASGQTGLKSPAYVSQLQKPAAGASYTTNTWISSATAIQSYSTGTATNGQAFTNTSGSTISITALGYWVLAGSYADRTVFVTDTSCAVLGTATVPIAGSSPGSFQFSANLGSPVSVANNAVVYIFAESGNFNDIGGSPTTITTTIGGNVERRMTHATCDSAGGISYLTNFKYYTP